jgi:Flp pilus assembly protein TadB
MTGYIAGAVFALGLLLVIDGLARRRRPAPPPLRRDATEMLAAASTRTLLASAGALGGATAAILLTHWIALAIIAGVLGGMAPASVAKARAAKQRLARQEALAVVADRLRNAVRSGRDLPEAIVMAADAAPPALRTEMTTLKDLLRRRGALEALDALAAASDDAFIRRFARTLSGAYESGSKLGTLLSAVAEAAWLETRTAKEVRTRQTSIRIAANLMGIIPVATLIYLRASNPAFLTPYSTASGQLVMLAGFGLVGAGWWAARSLGGLKR